MAMARYNIHYWVPCQLVPSDGIKSDHMLSTVDMVLDWTRSALLDKANLKLVGKQEEWLYEEILSVLNTLSRRLGKTVGDGRHASPQVASWISNHLRWLVTTYGTKYWEKYKTIPEKFPHLVELVLLSTESDWEEDLNILWDEFVDDVRPAWVIHQQKRVVKRSVRGTVTIIGTPCSRHEIQERPRAPKRLATVS